MGLKPWSKPRPTTEELWWAAMQHKLAHGPIEPWEIPVWVYDDGGNVTLLNISQYLDEYRKAD